MAYVLVCPRVLLGSRFKAEEGRGGKGRRRREARERMGRGGGKEGEGEEGRVKLEKLCVSM